MINTDDCWHYAKLIDTVSGYGIVCTKNNNYYAHRVMYENMVGEIPKDLQIDHLCRVRRCINPLHLEAVTRKENILRGNGMGARMARKTHCLRGHEFTPENTYKSKRGRECRTCRKYFYNMS